MPSLKPSTNSTLKLSLICPTIGRPSLRELLIAVSPMLNTVNELIVVGDGPQDGVKELCAQFPAVRYHEVSSRAGDYGCTPCDEGIKIARGDYVFFTGDDDMPVENVFDILRKVLTHAPRVPHVFAMMHTGRKLSRSLECSHVSGQQIVIPRDMTRMPKMAAVDKKDWLVSDWVFIQKVKKAWNGMIIFRDEVINVLPKQRFGA